MLPSGWAYGRGAGGPRDVDNCIQPPPDLPSGPPALPTVELEQVPRVLPQDPTLRRLGQERQVVDRGGQVEVPVRVVGREEELRLGVDLAERHLQQLVVAVLDRL